MVALVASKWCDLEEDPRRTWMRCTRVLQPLKEELDR